MSTPPRVIQKASEAEIKAYEPSVTYARLYGWVVVDGRACVIESLDPGARLASGSGWRYEVLAPEGLIFKDEASALLCSDLRDLHDRLADATLVPNPDEIEAPAAEPVVETAARCPIPPPGWHCTREPGHAPPCAAVPDGTGFEIDFKHVPSGRPVRSPSLTLPKRDLVAAALRSTADDVDHGDPGTLGPVVAEALRSTAARLDDPLEDVPMELALARASTNADSGAALDLLADILGLYRGGYLTGADVAVERALKAAEALLAKHGKAAAAPGPRRGDPITCADAQRALRQGKKLWVYLEHLNPAEADRNVDEPLSATPMDKGWYFGKPGTDFWPEEYPLEGFVEEDGDDCRFALYYVAEEGAS